MAKGKEKTQAEKDAIEKAKNEKFKSVVNPRLNKLRYEIGRIIRMTQQPNYVIYDTDAQSIVDKVFPELETFVDIYSKIAKGESVRKSKKEIENVF